MLIHYTHTWNDRKMVHGLRIMFGLAFNVILFALFLIGMIFGLKTKETGMGLLSGSVALIIALNSLFILNS